MRFLNQVILLGNLVAEPELQTTVSGKLRAVARLAINHYYRTKKGERVEETCYIRLEFWDRRAQWFFDRASKGSSVLVSGRLRYYAFTRDGQRRASYRVQVGTFRVLDRIRGSKS